MDSISNQHANMYYSQANNSHHNSYQESDSSSESNTQRLSLSINSPHDYNSIPEFHIPYISPLNNPTPTSFTTPIPTASSYRPLTLSVSSQSSSYPPNSMQLHIQRRNFNSSNNENYPSLSMSPSIVQGPNTNEYYGHDVQSNKNIDSEPAEYQYDPYDQTNGEQKFCNGYGEWGHVITHNEHTILPDLKQYPFTDDIKNQADLIYNKMTYRVRRGKIRSQLLFFCVYYAHVELDRDVNPTQLGSLFDLTPGEVQRCDSLFSPLQTGYRPPSTSTSPLRYLPGYCQEIKLSEEAIIEIRRLATSILNKDPDLRQENPQTVAAGLLRYFTYTNGIITDDPQEITKVTGRSNVTIDCMFRRIAAIDNN